MFWKSEPICIFLFSSLQSTSCHLARCLISIFSVQPHLLLFFFRASPPQTTPLPTPPPTPAPPREYNLVLRKSCGNCYIAAREVTLYSDVAGTSPLVAGTPGVVSLTASSTSTLSFENYDFGANKCIDGVLGGRCASDGYICHSGAQANPAFTFTLISEAPPASFRIHYRRCSTNNFPPTLATLNGGDINYSTALSNSVDSALYVTT